MGMRILKFQEGNEDMQISSNCTFFGHDAQFLNADLFFFFNGGVPHSCEVYILNEIL